MIWLKNLNEKELTGLAYELGKRSKNKTLRIGLVGDLGSGKTTFTKSFAKAYGIKRIKSPSFILASIYKTRGRGEFMHADLYRLKIKEQLLDTGVVNTENKNLKITIIEWADKFKSVLKSCDIVIKFLINKDGTRDIKIY